MLRAMRSAPRDSRLATALAAAFLLGWVAYFVAPGLAPGKTLLATDLLRRFPPWSAGQPAGWQASNGLLSDQAVQFFPWRTLTGALAREGLPPLWNPFSGAGSPLLANYQSAPFAPLELLVAPLPWSLAPAVAAGLRLALAALGMLLFLRALRAGPLAAAFAALAFVGSGSVALLLYHPNSDVSCWLPLAAYLSLRVARRAGAAAGALLALVLGAQHLGGHPETSLYVVIGSLVAFSLGRLLREPGTADRAGAGEALATVAVAHLLGLLLAAIQVLPFLEYLGESGVLGERAGMRFANPPPAAVGLVVPGAFGLPTRPNLHFGPGNYHDVAMQYAGLATLVLALAGILSRAARRDRGPAEKPGEAWILPLAGLALAALLLAYPTPLWRLAQTAAPFRLSASVTGLTLLYSFAVSALGGLALEVLGYKEAGAAEPIAARRALAGLTLVVAVGAAAALAAWILAPLFRGPLLGYGEHALRLRFPHGLPSQPIEHYLARLPLVLDSLREAALATGILGASLAILLGARRRLSAAAFGLLAITVLAVDLDRFGRGYVPAIPVGEALPHSRVEALLQGPDVGRVLPTGRAFPPNTLTLRGVEDFRLSDAVGTRALARYQRTLVQARPMRRRFADYRRELVDAAGVDVVVSEEPLAAPGLSPLVDPAVAGAAPLPLHPYRNAAAWPRAFLVGREEGAAADEAAVERTAAVARAAASGVGGPGKIRHGIPGVVVLSAARAGTAVAPTALWELVERLFPGLRSPVATSSSSAGARPAGAGRDSKDPGWLGDPAFARGRLHGADVVHRRQGGRLVASGVLARGPLELDGVVEAKLAGWLVVLDQDYPGWEVTVDGKPAEPLRAYGLFRAVPLERGRHRVTWSYRPASFALGLCLSLIALAGTVLWLAQAIPGRAARSSPSPRR